MNAEFWNRTFPSRIKPTALGLLTAVVCTAIVFEAGIERAEAQPTLSGRIPSIAGSSRGFGGYRPAPTPPIRPPYRPNYPWLWYPTTPIINVQPPAAPPVNNRPAPIVVFQYDVPLSRGVLELPAASGAGSVKIDLIGGAAAPSLQTGAKSSEPAAEQPLSAELTAGLDRATTPEDWMPYLSHADHRVQQRAVDALTRLGADAVPALIHSMASPHRASASRAADVLAVVGPPAVPALVERLKDHDEEVRMRAARTLGEIGPPAADALPALKQAAQSEADPDVRFYFVAASAKIRG